MTFKGDTFIECLARTDPTDPPSFYTALEVVKRYCRTKIAKGKGRQFVGKGGKLEDLEKKYAKLGYQDIFYLTRLHMGFPPSCADLPPPTPPIRQILLKAKYPLPRELEDADFEADPFSSPQRSVSVRTTATATTSAGGERVLRLEEEYDDPDGRGGRYSTPQPQRKRSIVHRNTSPSPSPGQRSVPVPVPAPAEAPARRSSDLERLALPRGHGQAQAQAPGHGQSSRESRPTRTLSPLPSSPPTTPLPSTPSPTARRTGSTLPLNISRNHVSNYFSSSASPPPSFTSSAATSPMSPISVDGDGDGPPYRTRTLSSGAGAGAHTATARSHYLPGSGRPQLLRAEATSTSIEDDLLAQLNSLTTNLGEADNTITAYPRAIIDRPRAAYQSVTNHEAQSRKSHIVTLPRNGMETPPPKYVARP